MLRIREDLRHEWAVSAEEAHAIQCRLAEQVVLTSITAQSLGPSRIAVGVDVGYSRDGERAWACAVAMGAGFRVLERVVVPGVPDRAYAPGLLAFREGRLNLDALCALTIEPDLVFCDGHGVVHERGLGLASHVGVLLDVPVIGVPKTPFHAIDRLPDASRGSYLVLAKEWGAQGAAVRLRSGVKPVYVSPGHRVDLDGAIELCLLWSTGRHRVPEPLQAADTLSKMARNEVR